MLNVTSIEDSWTATGVVKKCTYRAPPAYDTDIIVHPTTHKLDFIPLKNGLLWEIPRILLYSTLLAVTIHAVQGQYLRKVSPAGIRLIILWILL